MTRISMGTVMMIFFTLKDQAYTETAILGGLLLAGAIIISFILLGRQWGMVAESIRALVVVYLCWYTDLLNPDLLVTQAVLLQALINLSLILLILAFSNQRALAADRKA